MSKKIFTRKQYGGSVYKWSPETTIVKKCDKCNSSNIMNDDKIIKKICNAIRFTQGEDWLTTYCYDLVFINGKYHRLAYVECDYVE